MSYSTQTELKSALEAYVSRMKDGSEIPENAPEVIQQIIEYQTVLHAVGTFFSLFILMGSIGMITFAIIEHYQNNKPWTVDAYFLSKSWSGLMFSVIFISAIVTIFSGFASAYNISALLQVVTAPKLFLIDYLGR